MYKIPHKTYYKTYKGFRIFIGFEICKPTNGGRPYAVWCAEGENNAGDYVNSEGRTFPTREQALIAIGNAIDYKSRKGENILP